MKDAKLVAEVLFDRFLGRFGLVRTKLARQICAEVARRQCSDHARFAEQDFGARPSATGQIEAERWGAETFDAILSIVKCQVLKQKS